MEDRSSNSNGVFHAACVPLCVHVKVVTSTPPPRTHTHTHTHTHTQFQNSHLLEDAGRYSPTTCNCVLQRCCTETKMQYPCLQNNRNHGNASCTIGSESKVQLPDRSAQLLSWRVPRGFMREDYAGVVTQRTCVNESRLQNSPCSHTWISLPWCAATDLGFVGHAALAVSGNVQRTTHPL